MLAYCPTCSNMLLGRQFNHQQYNPDRATQLEPPLVPGHLLDNCCSAAALLHGCCNCSGAERVYKGAAILLPNLPIHLHHHEEGEAPTPRAKFNSSLSAAQHTCTWEAGTDTCPLVLVLLSCTDQQARQAGQEASGRRAGWRGGMEERAEDGR